MTTAVLGFIGTALTISVTLLGFLFKNEVDKRTVALAERAEVARSSEQRRLQMDSALRTVQLLTLSDGTPAPPLQASSAVLVLAGIGETEMALSLVRELWPAAAMTSSTAVRVINDALLSEDVGLQRTAANALLSNVMRLDGHGHQQEWPSALDTWQVGWDVEVRQAVALTLIRWLTAHPAISGEDFRIRLLNEARARETDSSLLGLS